MTHFYELVADELAEPVHPRVTGMAAAIAAQYGDAARAVLFYGSCLRTAELDGQMLDFYLIVSSYEAAYRKSWLAIANRLLPPNVFPFEHDGLAAKYAVLSEADFHRLNGPETLSVSVWARFSQPVRLAWKADEQAEEACNKAICRAAPTLLKAAWPLLTKRDDPLDLWRKAFELTYQAELRPERKDRGHSIVDAFSDRYRLFSEPALRAALIPDRDPTVQERDEARKHWVARRRAGKMLSVLRIAKASATFAGGIDYLAWKINRHAGTNIQIRPWQRRFPLIATFTLLPRLLKRGAIR